MPYQKNKTSHYENFGGINAKTSVYKTNENQQLDIRNMDANIPHMLTKRPGYTQAIANGTTQPINSLYEYKKLDGQSFLVASSDGGFFSKSSTGLSLITSGLSGQPMDFLTYTDRLWAANGQTFYQWDGLTLTTYMLPCGPTAILGTATAGLSTGTFLGKTTDDGWISLRYALVRADGFIGPLTDNSTFFGHDSNDGSPDFYLTSQRTSGFTMYAPNQGVTAYAIYLAFSDVSYNSTRLNSNARFVTMMALSGTTFIIGSNAFEWESLPNGFSGQAFCFLETFSPKYIEIHNDRMFLSGFSSSPSSTFYSESLFPEVIQPEFFIDSRSNDGDRNTAIKSFQGDMLIFKQKSFSKVIGDNFDNYTQALLSTEYGCLSNKSIIEYDNILMWLDEKGIIRYDGANWGIISQPVEHIFRRINLSAALEKACAVHHQFRNQIWFGIPIDGSSQNNMTVVYDYLLNSWFLFDGFNPASFALIKQNLDTPTVWMGNYSGMINYFSSSFYGDNGAGISCVVQSKFDAPDGQNVESIFRRFFLDNNIVTGITGVINVQVFKNYDQSTIQATFAIYQNVFQSRADFGVPARSIGFKIGHNSASLPLSIPGYVVQRRYLREV